VIEEYRELLSVVTYALPLFVIFAVGIAWTRHRNATKRHLARH
jgi:hypothetical protein